MTPASPAQIAEDLGGTTDTSIKPFIDLFADREAAQAWLDRYHVRIAQQDGTDQARISGMLSVNPLYVLRNHIAQQAIEAAQRGDSTEIERVMLMLKNPFQSIPGMASYAALPPHWASSLEVSCSS